MLKANKRNRYLKTCKRVKTEAYYIKEKNKTEAENSN